MFQRVEQGSDSQDQYVLESVTVQIQLGLVWFREWNRVVTIKNNMYIVCGRLARFKISMFLRVGQGSDTQDQYVAESGAGQRQLGSVRFRERDRVATVKNSMFQRLEQGSDNQDRYVLQSGAWQGVLGSVCFREWDRVATDRISLFWEWDTVTRVGISMFQRVGQGSDCQDQLILGVGHGNESWDQYVLESGTGQLQLGSVCFREWDRVATIRISMFQS